MVTPASFSFATRTGASSWFLADGLAGVDRHAVDDFGPLRDLEAFLLRGAGEVVPVDARLGADQAEHALLGGVVTGPLRGLALELAGGELHAVDHRRVVVEAAEVPVRRLLGCLFVRDPAVEDDDLLGHEVGGEHLPATGGRGRAAHHRERLHRRDGERVGALRGLVGARRVARSRTRACDPRGCNCGRAPPASPGTSPRCTRVGSSRGRPAPIRRAWFRAVSCCSWEPTNKTILIVSFVTPIDVAPPLLSPFFMGRVHGARCWYGYASRPSAFSHSGELSAALVPAPDAGTNGPSFASATDAIAATIATTMNRRNGDETSATRSSRYNRTGHGAPPGSAPGSSAGRRVRWQ